MIKFFSSDQAKRVFEQSPDSNSEELDDYFKKYLAEQKIKLKKKVPNLILPEANDEARKESQSPMTIDLITPDPIDRRITYVIKAADRSRTPSFIRMHQSSTDFSFNHIERPSVNVTKTRPAYEFNDSLKEDDFNNNSPSLLNSTLDKIETVLTADTLTPQKVSTPASDLKKKLNSTLGLNQSSQSPRESSRNKFDHVQSPVAAYIHQSPRTPFSQNVRASINSKTPRFNFDDSINESDDEVDVETSSLPIKICTKSSKVVEVKILKIL